MPYFENFPLVRYDFRSNPTYKGTIDILTNIMARVKFSEGIKNNAFVYYEYDVKDWETPEIIADKYYGDPQLHWIILMANDIVNPYYDWPLRYDVFQRYIAEKYGSVEAAQTTTDHYEMVIVREDSKSGIETTSRFEIDSTTYDDLPETTFNTYNLADGTTVQETITKEAITIYDKENDANEAKRTIKLIKKDHVDQIVRSFTTLMNARSNQF